MVQSFMLRKEYGENLEVVNLGYITHPQTQKLGDRLRKVIGRKHFQVEVNGTLCIEISIKKDKILKEFSQIKKGSKFMGSDYYVDYGTENPYDVNWHPQNVARNGLPRPNGMEEENDEKTMCKMWNTDDCVSEE